MTKTKLTLTAPKHFLPEIKCNGKLLRLKRTAKNTYAAEFEYKESQPQTIHVFKYYPLTDGLWFVYGLFFYIIGFFGIFSPRWERKCPSVNTQFTLQNPQTQIDLTLNPIITGNRALTLNGDQSQALDAETNIYTTNTLAQKRAKKVKLFSWLTLLALIIITTTLTLL